MRLAITCNGPGETAGWLRPLLRALEAQAPDVQIAVFYVPDDYATGREAAVARELFPHLQIFDPKTYLRVALGGRPGGLPTAVDAVLYLGGDLMHAARLHGRLGGELLTYKFSRPRYAKRTAHAFAVDAANAEQLAEWGITRERITTVGNLAIDGALVEGALEPEPGTPEGGVLFMPGSRGYEVENLVPMLFTAALHLQRERPGVPLAFGISPFTPLDEVRRAIEAGGDARIFAQRGALLETGGRAFLCDAQGRHRIPIVRNALAAARRARLTVTIPGTKVIELAALGCPVVAISPLNAPEKVTINGPLTYLDRIPLAGVALKRAIVAGVSRRHRFHTQPNIDSGRELVCELHGTLTPGRIARVAAQRLLDDEWLQSTAQALAALYREHAGAAQRFARALLQRRDEQAS